MRIPTVTASWLNEVRPPRARGGATSEMYIGETKEAVPTASPSRKRKPMSMPMLTLNAAPIAPTT